MYELFRADPSLPDTPIVHASDVFCELTGLHCKPAFSIRHPYIDKKNYFNLLRCCCKNGYVGLEKLGIVWIVVTYFFD